MEQPRVCTLQSIEWETERHATIRFHDEPIAASAPGTFCMVWVPGVDEVPMGIGYTDAAGRATLTVEAKGDCTQALLDLDPGARIGVRGPYGTGFALPERTGHVCFVGGGTGIAPMARGAQAAHEAGHHVTVIGGARTADLLLLHGHLQQQEAAGRLRYIPCTDDGSHGFSGRTTECLQAEGPSSFDKVYACGPEAMMVAVAKQCGDVPVQASLERYMKCAIGICDACTLGDGLRLCVEGPVLDGTTLARVPEFGTGHRDASGILRPW